MKLQSILMPHSEFDHQEKGDALHGECGSASVFIEDANQMFVNEI